MISDQASDAELRIARAVADAHVSAQTVNRWAGTALAHAAALAESRRGAAAAAVVAEAVAVALEAVAAAASEALAERAVEVAQAAQLVVDAAGVARGARESAAVAAAQALALDAEQTAKLVQAQADVSAAQVKGAAETAARDRARSLASGTLPDEALQARLLASSVCATAEATAQEARRAAAIVASAASEAASSLVYARGVAEHGFGSDATAARLALECQASVTAAHVARVTNAHAKGVALVAREAAAAASYRLELIRQQTETRVGSAQARTSPPAQRGDSGLG